MSTRVSFCLLMIGSACLLRAQEGPELTPSLHAYGIYGVSSADHPADFAPGGHDPKEEEALKLQSLEPSLSLRWGHLQGFATGLAFTDEHDDLEWEWEEVFLKLVDLPGGMELRGGRMLTRTGLHNPVHLHGWSTVDAPLPHALFLGEDGLAVEGGDLSFHLDTRHPTVLTLGFGGRPPHEHDHGHGEEDHDEDHGEDHEEEEHEEEHGHEGFGGFEEARVNDDIFSVGLRRDHVFDDFRTVRLAAFGAMGDNEEGKNSWLAGAGAEYEWRENGLEPGGRALRVRAEAIRFLGDMHGEEGHDEHEEEDHSEDHEEYEEEEHGHEEAGGSVSSWGLSTQVVYEAHPHAHPFARVDYVAAADALETDDWVRYSAGITIPFGADPLYTLRVQGNADERGDESEQSLWLQFGFSWGGPEVR